MGRNTSRTRAVAKKGSISNQQVQNVLVLWRAFEILLHIIHFRGKAKIIIFVSGDQHWAELMAKRMPDSLDYGPAQTLYEVTASGKFQI